MKSNPSTIESLLAKYDLLPGWKLEDFPTKEIAPENQIPELERLIATADALGVLYHRCNVEGADSQIFDLYKKLWEEIGQRILGTGLHLVIARRPEGKVKRGK